MEAALPCKMGTEKCSRELQDTASETTESNKKDKACVVEAHASTRQRLESTHEDHIAVKRFNSISPCNLVHTFIQMPAMKIPDAEAAVDKEWEKLEKLQAWQLNKVKSKEGGYSGSRKRQKESPICDIDGHLSSQKMPS